MTAEPTYRNLDLGKIERARELVRAALVTELSETVRAGLSASLDIFESLLEPPQAERSTQYDGSIEYTFEDEDYEPFGRAIDVRVYYRWHNYDPADDPRPMWGATVEDLEVLGIRYFDESGNEVPGAKHPADVAWHLLDKSMEQVAEACTEDGYRRGAGRAPLTYAPGKIRMNIDESARPAKANFELRMAPSISTRPAQLDRRQMG